MLLFLVSVKAHRAMTSLSPLRLRLRAAKHNLSWSAKCLSCCALLKIWLFRGFLLKFHFKQLSLLKVVFLFPFPYISRQRKDSQHSPRPSTSPVVYYEEQDAGRFSAQERRNNFGLCQAKKPSKDLNGQRFHDSRRCASSYLMCC